MSMNLKECGLLVIVRYYSRYKTGAKRLVYLR